MKILQLYNRRDTVWGGEDYVVENTIQILERKNEQVISWILRNSDLMSRFNGKLRAFTYGIYSPPMQHAMAELIKREQPDIVHVHNLYPFFSPSVLISCRRARVPVVLHYHSHFLTCPTSWQFRDGKICERCTGGREYWCILKNCRGNIVESIGYALRSAVARKFRLLADNVTLFITTADFTKQRLVEAGFSKDQVVVVPCAITLTTFTANPSIGKHVVYAGRLSPEKGVETFIAAARLLPQLKFLIAGDGPIRKELEGIAPENVTFVGWLNKIQLSDFYSKARLAVVPSRWLEPFGLVVTDAMSNGLPVVASRIGGPSEIVEEEVTGLLFQPGNSVELAEKINTLWTDPDLCRRMGQDGREKAIREYSEDVYYGRLMAVYKIAIEVNNKRKWHKANS
jgi:glycosyltransferase involved in cell wall biosynthesis